MRHKFLYEVKKRKHSLNLLPYQKIYELVQKISSEFGVRFFIFKNDSFFKGFLYFSKLIYR